MSARRTQMSAWLDQVATIHPELAQALRVHVADLGREAASYRGQLRTLQVQIGDNMHGQLLSIGNQRHYLLIQLLRELEAMGNPAELPPAARDLQRAIWPFLQAYGVRDSHGSVDDRAPEQPRRPAGPRPPVHSGGAR